MSGKAIGLSMGYGYAGTVSMTPTPFISSKPVAADSDPIKFGLAVVQNTDNTYDAATSTTVTAANFAGVAVAEVKQLTTYPSDTDDVTGTYLAEQPCDVIKQGVVSVKCQRGTPTNGGAVYVRTALNGSYPDAVVGGFEASSDGGNSVAVTNCTWATNAIDANLITQLLIKTINN